jgi:hypothetical protein
LVFLYELRLKYVEPERRETVEEDGCLGKAERVEEVFVGEGKRVGMRKNGSRTRIMSGRRHSPGLH